MTPPSYIGFLPDFPCAVCDRQLAVRWTDHWGIAACWNCGTPYRLYFSTKEGVETPSTGAMPELQIISEWLPLVRKYWQETGRLVEPGSFIYLGDRYDVATQDDFETWIAWMNAHKEEWPIDYSETNKKVWQAGYES